MKKTKETEAMLQNLRETFTDEDYNKYLSGDLKLKDIYMQFNCTENVLRYLFKERNYLSRGTARKSAIKEDIFDIINSEESAYILGFYIADGCISNNKFIIALQEQDKEILEKIRDIMSPITKLNLTKERVNKSGIITHPMYKFAFACKHITERLEELGYGKGKTEKEKTIKNIVPYEYMWHFIRGYWDGDGCISASETIKKVNGKEYHHTNIGFTIISKDKNILEEINNFYKQEGIDSYIYPDNKGNYLVGTHSLPEIEKIYFKLYNNCSLFLKRKRDKFDKIMKIPS